MDATTILTQGAIEALIRSSKGDRVIVSLGDGRFKVRKLTTGIESDGRIEILSGLKVGECVVTSGQFLIDSESNLKAGLERLDSKEETKTTQDKKVQGRGVIKSIELTKRLIKLDHEAITDLGWPAMKMDFSVDKQVNLQDFEINDKVGFSLKKEDQQFVIVEMSKIN